MSGEPLASVAERSATGETAEIYADIRATMRLPVVNLIWRHFATLDGGLRWAWETLRPIYASDAAARAGARLVAGLRLPAVAAFPAPVLRAAGVSGDVRAVVCAILDGYDRGNALNICALSALAAAPSAAPAGAAADAPALPLSEVAVPPIAELGELGDDVRALVHAVNALGRAPGDDVVASAWRHLAPWPGYLALAWTLLEPMHRAGHLAAAVDDTRRAARREGARLAHLRASVAEPASAVAVRAAAEHFVEHVIAAMIPIVRILRRATP